MSNSSYTSTMTTDYDHLFKVLCIGDTAVGKSSLVNRYVDDEFNQRFISTIGVDFRIKTIERNGKVVKLQIWDTAGQERFRAITTSYYRGADGVIMVYDITNPESLESLSRTWVNEVRAFAAKHPRIVLVGNKTDLVKSMPPKTALRMTQLLEDIKNQMVVDGVVDIVEVSSKTGKGVDYVFDTLVDNMLSMNRAVNTGSVQKQKDIPVGISLFGSGSPGPDVRRGLCCSLL